MWHFRAMPKTFASSNTPPSSTASDLGLGKPVIIVIWQLLGLSKTKEFSAIMKIKEDTPNLQKPTTFANSLSPWHLCIQWPSDTTNSCLRLWVTKESHLQLPPCLGKSSSCFLLIGLVFLRMMTSSRFTYIPIPTSQCYVSKFYWLYISNLN